MQQIRNIVLAISKWWRAGSDHSAVTAADTERQQYMNTEVDTVNSRLTTDNEDNTSDTLTLARLDRENQGPWEFEYNYGGEADLHRHYTRCKKNPGHKNFIPVDKFSIEDLPEDYRAKEVVDYIRAVSDLTVRVKVGYVSDKRPKSVSHTNKPYPGYSIRGQRRVAVGTGWVSSTEVHTSDVGQHCRCKDCCNSSTPEMNFAIVEVITATHLVFDGLEGERTTCHLFFDRGDTPDTCSSVIALTGMSDVLSYCTKDWCLMKHYTHDLALARKLQMTSQQMKRLRDNVIIKDKMWQWRMVKQKRDFQDKMPLLFVVSHPHGCSKQISLGYITSVHMFSNTISSLLYNTATCPGSSGAHLLVYLLPFNSVTLDVLHLTTGPWEDNFCSVEEGDENQHYAACKKNRGHGNFFPVDKFGLDHLPPFYRRDDIMKLVKLISDLTVRVTVKYVSEKRPVTVQRTDISYPWFGNRGSQLTRVGTGSIRLAQICDDLDCGCRECRNSPKPKSPLAYIAVHTAGHLVYDELEAEHTTCQLFYDLEETNDNCTSVVTLADVRRFSTDTALDLTAIEYFTHDLDLVRRTESIISQYSHTLRNIEALIYEDSKQNSVDNAKYERPLHIVVSHPHGCAKQVSVCCWGNPGNADTEDSQCSHSSAVCPGSSGAQVIDLTWKLLYPCVE